MSTKNITTFIDINQYIKNLNELIELFKEKLLI